LEDRSTIGVFLFDVVTRTDDAGDVTEKQNSEWFFNYTPQLEETTGPVSRQRLRLT
jgi:hypothetical protein